MRISPLYDVNLTVKKNCFKYIHHFLKLNFRNIVKSKFNIEN
jgi:hypothetical protein